MITSETIIALANKYQTTEQTVSREYIQHLFLNYFYQQSCSSATFFKGGTALRIIYNSPRFSEDLDFTSASEDIKKIEDCVLASLHEIKREGIEAEIIESKQTSGGYLAIINFVVNRKSVTIQLEASFRKKNTVGEIVTVVNDFIRPYTLMQLSQGQLVQEKIQALLRRQKPRDFYDLYFLLRANLLSKDDKAMLPKIVVLFKKNSIDFKKELKLFLPKYHWAIIRDFN